MLGTREFEGGRRRAEPEFGLRAAPGLGWDLA